MCLVLWKIRGKSNRGNCRPIGELNIVELRQGRFVDQEGVEQSGVYIREIY